MSVSINEIVQDVSELTSLPEVSIKVNQMVDDPNCGVNEIGKVISQDPALSAQLLRIANSPFYGFSATIDSISRAVTVLGTQQIRDLVFSTTATKAFNGIPNEIISVDDFWHHSLYCGLLARELANQNHKAQGEMLFTAGLLHDIGHLVMFNRIPELALQAIMHTIEPGVNLELYQSEREVIGFDHAEVGGRLAKQWQLPNNLVECVMYHHEPERAKEYPDEVLLVYIANKVASQAYEADELEPDEVLEIIPEARLQKCLLTTENVLTAVKDAHSQVSDVESLLFSK
ncbi:MAG: HDOD domain-containing protein [Gammaproteobacteria bacterium]